MSRGPKYITIEGQFAADVLGTFRIIRGFASLQDLAAISTPHPMLDGPATNGNVEGYQRKVGPAHAEDIKRYLERGKLRFLPEIILSIRADFHDELDAQQHPIGVQCRGVPGMAIQRRWISQNIRTHAIKIERAKLNQLVHGEKRIRRIDGNHRLHLAHTLATDNRVPNKYLAPFCAVLLGPPGDEADNYNEAMLFQTINSTALPLGSEHALQLILGQRSSFGLTPDEEFANSPALYLTRALRGRIDQLPPP